MSSCACNCFFAIRATIGSPSLKNPPGSPSKPTTTLVPPPSGSKVLVMVSENGLSVWVTNRLLGSCWMTSEVDSILRPRNLARCWILVPTRTGVSDGRCLLDDGVPLGQLPGIVHVGEESVT